MAPVALLPPREPAQLSPAEGDGGVGAVRVARRDVREGSSGDASAVDRAQCADGIDGVPEERRDDTVVPVVVFGVARVQVELRGGVLDAKATLKLELADLCVEHGVGGMHQLVIRKVADAHGVGYERGSRGVEHLSVQRGVEALERSLVSCGQPQGARYWPIVVQLERALVGMCPAGRGSRAPERVSPPLVPASASCFSTMLMIPATPSGSSRADGFGTTSTLSTMSADSCARKLPSCAGLSGLFRPLICRFPVTTSDSSSSGVAVSAIVPMSAAGDAAAITTDGISRGAYPNARMRTR
jgi:hypothetical protein